MAAPGLDQVMAFLTDHGFAGAASALRDDVLERTAAGDDAPGAALDPRLPPLRMPGSASAGGAGTPAPASPGSSSGSASSSAFVSMRSTPSGTPHPRHEAFLSLALNPPPPLFPLRNLDLCAGISVAVVWIRAQFGADGVDQRECVACAHEFLNINRTFDFLLGDLLNLCATSIPVSPIGWFGDALNFGTFYPVLNGNF
jgi:hypothetical protein